MRLQDRLIELAEYGIGFNMHDGNFLVNITYKDGWSVIKPSDESISFMHDSKRTNTYYYSAPITTDIAHIFEAIDETITYNKEMEEKVQLFKERVEELQELFAKLPLSMVRKLTFTVPEDSEEIKKQPKKKTTRKKSQKKPKEEEPQPTPEAAAEEPALEEVTVQPNNDVDFLIESAMKEKEQETWQQ